MNYYQFNAEDFAADDYFKDWVCAPDAESDDFWENFLKDYPEKYYPLEEGRILVQALQHIHPATVDENQVSKLWARIEETVSGQRQNWFQSHIRTKIIWQAAASVIVLLGIGWLWQGKPWPMAGEKGTVNVKDQDNWTETVNGATQTMQVLLADGSKIYLEKDSRIRYTRKFTGAQRVVYLQGEAFFEVTKDPSKPFLVYANGLVTKVLGTSFRIRAHNRDPDVTVAVRSGRVSVYSDKSARSQDPEAKGIVLSPNQKAIFQREMATLTKTLVEKPSMLIQKGSLPSFLFEDAPAAKVFETLEKVYGIDVVFDEELMKNCTLTINLNEEDLFQKLEVICKVLEARYKLIDAQVIIYSKGC